MRPWALRGDQGAISAAHFGKEFNLGDEKSDTQRWEGVLEVMEEKNEEIHPYFGIASPRSSRFYGRE